MNTTTNRKPIPGYEKYYLIDEDGRVWKSDGTELKPHLSGVPRRNYYQVTLYGDHQNGRRTKRTYRVHVLMGITFLGFESDRFIVVDHKDNDPLNNKLSNLQPLSTADNNRKDRKDRLAKFRAVEIDGVPF